MLLQTRLLHYELINKVSVSFSRPFLFEELQPQGGRLSDFMLARALTPPLVTLVLHKGVPQLDVEDV